MPANNGFSSATVHHGRSRLLHDEQTTANQGSVQKEQSSSMCCDFASSSPLGVSNQHPLRSQSDPQLESSDSDPLGQPPLQLARPWTPLVVTGLATTGLELPSELARLNSSRHSSSLEHLLAGHLKSGDIGQNNKILKLCSSPKSHPAFLTSRQMQDFEAYEPFFSKFRGCVL